jgi:hypothetical protein
MKKFTIIGLAICLAFALAAPATAVDVDFSGDYYVRGAYTEHWNLDDRSASNAYMDMRFRLQTVFKVNDILSVTTRFDALDDKVWGDTDETTATSNSTFDYNFPPATSTVDTTTDVNSDIDFDRAYMTIKAPIGAFHVGRMSAGVWGTAYLDSVTDKDRIKFVKKIDNLTLYAIFQKNAENDNATGAGDAADEDSDTYYLLGKYKAERTTTGLLLAFTNNKTVNTQTTHVYTAIPYFVSKFGPLAIQGELGYKWGETEYDAGGADLDIKKLAYNLEATYNFGPASIMAGYAFVSGDGDATDDENSAYGGVGDDWGKLFILTTTDVGVLENLGGQSNLSATGNYGAKIIYGGATFSPLDNLELGVVVGTADADELRTGESQDDYGVEYDFTLNWKIYDNLTYSAVAAFLSAGDFYKEQSAIPDANFDDTYALFHQLELAF